MKKTFVFMSLFVILALLAACAQPKEAAILTVAGKDYSQSALESLGTMSVDYTNKDGETTTYEGVSLVALLEDAGSSGSTVTFTASDDYEAEMTFDEAVACGNCIVAFDDGSLRMVMPDLSSKLQVKDVVSININ
jgi:hypothetical protein